MYGKPFNSHSKLHKNVATSKNYQGFARYINVSLDIRRKLGSIHGFMARLMHQCKVLVAISVRLRKRNLLF